MKTTTNRSVVISFVIVTVLLLLFGAGVMTAGIMHGSVQESGWMDIQSWMWTPALFTLGLGVVLGSFIFKKKGVTERYLELIVTNKPSQKDIS